MKKEKLTKKDLKKAYNSLVSKTKIKSTFALDKEKIMVKTVQKISDSKYIYPLAYFNILSVYYNETKGILESTQYTKNPDAVLNYVNYILNKYN
jgi:hypothetical protein